MWVTIAIALLFVSLIWSLTGRRKGLPPGPTCYPIIGNVGLFKPSEAVQGHRRLRKIYGDFYSMMIFHKPMIIVHGYQNIRELLGKHGDMFSERPKGFASEVITKGKGLIWSSGPLWKEQRTFALTTMRKFGFGRRCMESQIIEEVDCLMNELKKYKNKAFDIQTPLNTSVSNVICSLLYGKRFDYDDYKFKRLISILNKLFSTGNASSPANIFPSLRHIPCFSLDSVIENVRSLKGFVKEMIEEHKRNFDEDNINDYIDTYLLEQKQRSNEVDTTFTGNAEISTFTGNAEISTFTGNAEICTFTGNAEISTFTGNAEICTFTGNAEISTFTGNAEISTFTGNAEISTFTGNAEICTFTGNVSLINMVDYSIHWERISRTNGSHRPCNIYFISLLCRCAILCDLIAWRENRNFSGISC
ncbi:cytochrome P450 2C8-like isoform X2 [Ostrea edulis]|uniref:cytochrome P450 2C8-like isoform X2 n=1 Tax=Ostrea edulis TaxID=37623 RepID=UPI0024AFBB0D|nr:cytochrome P450 2C8-like isoform X2 [Ostrea edulis]